MKIVIALGGNALGNSPKEQIANLKDTAKHIVDLVSTGNDVIVTHGNGPQVGMINLAMENAHKELDSPDIPFAECGAMSQGYIGYHLQQTINEELQKRKIDKYSATIITQVRVDKNDEAFNNPTKPIGSFYTKEEAIKIETEKGYRVKEDSGRGYRRVIASPLPLEIVELNSIKQMTYNGNIVIACGGGGIPVIRENNSYEGIAAVIDKDRTSALLASEIDADILLILTAVDKVAINFGKENEKWLSEMTVNEAKQYIEDGEFAKGSMLPKVEACLEFVEKSNKKAVITSLKNAKNAITGSGGTVIVKEGGEL